jgi:hypothetical protein
MKYLFLIISFLILFCEASYSQKNDSTLTVLKNETIKLDEFNKLDSMEELTGRPLRVDKYTAYILCEGSGRGADSACRGVAVITVNSNSLKDPEFLKLLRKFSPPFDIIFDDVRVLDLENKERGIVVPAIRVL